MRDSKILTNVYNIKFGLDHQMPGFTYQSDFELLKNTTPRSEFLRDLALNQTPQGKNRTPRQHDAFIIHKESQKVIIIPKQQLKCLKLLIQGNCEMRI